MTRRPGRPNGSRSMSSATPTAAWVSGCGHTGRASRKGADMPLTCPTQPEAVTKAAREGIARLSSLERSMPTKQRYAAEAAPALGPAVEVYALETADLRAGRGEEAARSVGW